MKRCVRNACGHHNLLKMSRPTERLHVHAHIKSNATPSPTASLKYILCLRNGSNARNIVLPPAMLFLLHPHSHLALQVKDRADLLKYIRSASDPVAVGEVSDAYGAIKQDIEVRTGSTLCSAACHSPWCGLRHTCNQSVTAGARQCSSALCV